MSTPTYLRELQSANTSNSTTSTKTSYTQTNVQSGGTIPDFQIAEIDKYGQIISDFSSKIRVTVDSGYYTKDTNTMRYTPVLEGTQQYFAYGGVIAVDGLEFTAAPGYKYRLSFTSSGIDESLPENKAFLLSNNITSVDFDFYVQLRECEMGEYFT